MPDFASQYRALYDRFGYPLGKTHGMAVSALDKAADRLNVVIPDALRDYYTVAGSERRFNRSLQTFLHPSKWFLDQRHIAFVEENQACCWWGVSVKSRGARDPMVSQGVNQDDSIDWHKEHDKCSTFISVLLHYQAVSGGFRFCASGAAPDDAHKKLKQHDWRYVGELNQLWAFHRQNQVVCIMAGGGLPFMPAMMLMAGGKSAEDIQSIGNSLGIELS
jgi:hypothetical protein